MDVNTLDDDIIWYGLPCFKNSQHGQHLLNISTDAITLYDKGPSFSKTEKKLYHEYI